MNPNRFRMLPHATRPLLLPLLLGGVLALFASLAAAHQPRIVGGQQVASGAYPWMAAILYRGGLNDPNNQFCGGSLIHPSWVLTAAHCVMDEFAADIEVVLGREDLNATGGERIPVAEILYHADYPQFEDPDVALLRLATPSSQTPIALLESNSTLAAPGAMATTIGWGLTTNQGSMSTDLLGVTLPIVSQQTCNSAYGGTITEETMLCAGPDEGGKDSCTGDSGGPLFVQDSQSNALKLAGIVSFGDVCGQAGSYGVYTRVSSQLSWIDNAMGSDSPVSTGASGSGSSSGGSTLSGALESPFEGSSESGVGIVRGWVCSAGSIQMSVDGGALKDIPYGGARGDTVATCGDKNNGFGTTFNYNLLGSGSHNLKLYVDGALLGNVNFTVQTLGVNYLTGASGIYDLPDFPGNGQTVRIEWSEKHQNFVITNASN